MNRLILRSWVTALFLLVLLSVPSIASADSAPILWTLSGVTFANATTPTVTGGTATGSFQYDPNTNTFSNIDIVTTAGSGFGGATYTTLSGAGFVSSNTSLWLGASSAPFTGPLFLLTFSNALGNAGGVTDFLVTGIDLGGGEGTCDDAACVGSTEDRFITGGAVTSAVVTPEPSALSFLAVGLMALLAAAAIGKTSQA